MLAITAGAGRMHFFGRLHRIQELGQIAGSVLQVHHAFQQHPIQTVGSAKQRTRLSTPTVTTAMKHLENAGIVRELTSKQRNRLFGYERYMTTLNEGTTTPGVAWLTRSPPGPNEDLSHRDPTTRSLA